MQRPANWLIVPALVLSLSATVAAQPPGARLPVRLSITSLVARSRSQSPQLVEVSLNSNLNQLQEGELELKFYVGGRQVAEYLSDPVVLTGETQRFRFLLPAITKHHDNTPVNVVGRWLVEGSPPLQLGGETGGEKDFVVPAYWRRYFVIGLARPELVRQSREGLAMESALAFERFNVSAIDRLDLTTYPTPIAPSAFPTAPIAYTAFDLLLLEGDGLSDLNEAQLAAIATWVEAGGSVFVRPNAPLRPVHLAFLDRLTALQPERENYRTDEQARLDRESGPAREPFLRCRCGLGRVVVMHRPLDQDEDFTSPDWIEASLFLWKTRKIQADAVRTTGHWSYQVPDFRMDGRGPKGFAPQEESPAARLRELLMPGRVQGLPFWVVVTILVLFLLTIAPGDYYFLGLFRARRYTWLLLTALSLAFTFSTVRIAEKVMGTTDYRTSLVVVDLGSGANAVRSSRFELLFTATQRMIETQEQQDLFVEIDDRFPHYSPDKTAHGFYFPPVDLEDEMARPKGLAADLLLYRGKIPASYSARRQMRQWSPFVSRRTSFSLPIDVPPLDWEQLDPNSWNGPDDGLPRLRRELTKLPPGTRVLLFHDTRFAELTDHLLPGADPATPSPELARLFEPAPPVDESNSAPFTATGRYPFAYGSSKYTGPPPPDDKFQAMVQRLSVRPARGLFGVVSRVAPTAADTFEDLPLLDSSNPREWLLVVAVPGEQDQFVYRKLYGEAP